jgi:hypothetical protein
MVNLLRFTYPASTFSNRARPESRRFLSRVGHGAVAFFASDPPRTGRLSELRDMFLEHYDAVFRVAVCRVFGLPSPRVLFTLRSPLLVLLAIFRFKLYMVHSSRQVSTCQMTRGLLHLLTTWLDAGEMLLSTPVTLGY